MVFFKKILLWLILFLLRHVDASFEKYPATFFYCLIDEMCVPYLKLWSEAFTKTNLILACTLFTWSYICICCLMPSIKLQQDSFEVLKICVSKCWCERNQNTVQKYLVKTGHKGMLWIKLQNWRNHQGPSEESRFEQKWRLYHPFGLQLYFAMWVHCTVLKCNY